MMKKKIKEKRKKGREEKNCKDCLKNENKICLGDRTKQNLSGEAEQGNQAFRRLHETSLHETSVQDIRK
jgi:hypothetical protein